MKKIAFLFLLCALVPWAQAMEVAPRISDREIVEALTELKAGQRALETRMDGRINTLEAKLDERFRGIDQRFASIDQRFADIDKRLDFMQNLMLVLVAGVFGLIGFVVWDRYSTLRPLDLRLKRIEEELERDLELKSPEGSRLTRLIHALRELAKTNEEVAAVLKSFSLL